jgi:hypothetical protein
MTAQERYKYETGKEALCLGFVDQYCWVRTSDFIQWLEKVVDQLDVEKDKD